MFADVHVLPPAATAVVTANGGGMTIQERRKWPAQNVPSGLGAAASMVFLFAVATGTAVGNLYYAQPLLEVIAKDLR